MEAVIWKRPCVLALKSCGPFATCGSRGTFGFRNGGRAPQRTFILRVINSTGSGAVVARPSSARKYKRSEGVDRKLAALRQLFHKPGLQMDAYIIPSQDPHQSEFIAECFMRRAFISGFTGSAGTAVVTKDKASLWTDGRYFLQAENQLGPDWTLMRAGTPGVPTISEWLTDVLSPGSKVGIDPFLFSSDAAEELKHTLSTKDHKLIYVYDGNLVDEIWKEDRPKPPAAPVRVHDIKYAGLDVSSKISSLRQNLVEAGATSIVISMLDEIAWLLNLRGNDVAHSPVAYAYLIVELDSTTLFIDPSKITPEVIVHLRKSNVTVKSYESLLLEVERLANCGSKLWLDTSCTNVAIVDAFHSACNKYFENLPKRSKQKSIKERNKLVNAKSIDSEMEGPLAIHKASPVAIAKAIKNGAELDGMRQAHLRDAAALAEFWTWLETKVVQDKMTFTEVEVADKLLEFRSKQAGFLDTSFDTISGSGANGAIIHYRAEPDTCDIVDDTKLYLLDSGGQYVDGTTDVTRTVHLGEPSSREKECFTRVLQGHIALDQAVFPENTPGFVLDVLARSSLWKIGLDYRHGTGHGVGASLNVHEGPQGISYRYENMTGLQGGMIVSNEPGYYEDRSFGIRIENLVIVRDMETPNRFGGNSYLGFEKLTFVPIQSKLLDLSLMSPAEIEWLNNYHSEVWEKVSPLIQGDVHEWLWKNTRPVPVHSTA
uniref:Metallopeptidase M24 family protein n=1 Tax=Juniperus oxycedrus TaxID=69008 RepID=A0A3Q8BPZ1_JUNOX|nr:metallopeptidase M24 family protein [Juniperus oxycedrus]